MFTTHNVDSNNRDCVIERVYVHWVILTLSQPPSRQNEWLPIISSHAYHMNSHFSTVFSSLFFYFVFLNWSWSIVCLFKFLLPFVLIKPEHLCNLVLVLLLLVSMCTTLVFPNQGHLHPSWYFCSCQWWKKYSEPLDKWKYQSNNITILNYK